MTDRPETATPWRDNHTYRSCVTIAQAALAHPTGRLDPFLSVYACFGAARALADVASTATSFPAIRDEAISIYDQVKVDIGPSWETFTAMEATVTRLLTDTDTAFDNTNVVYTAHLKKYIAQMLAFDGKAADTWNQLCAIATALASIRLTFVDLALADDTGEQDVVALVRNQMHRDLRDHLTIPVDLFVFLTTPPKEPHDATADTTGAPDGRSTEETPPSGH